MVGLLLDSTTMGYKFSVNAKIHDQKHLINEQRKIYTESQV